MIFVARQLVEKTLEHNNSLFILFADLRKAYNSVLRNAFWKVLQKCGIAPTTYVKRMKSFHNGMQASIRVASSSSLSSSPGFGVRNGLGQGCTLVLFNLYYNAVVSNWRSQCPQAEVEPCCVLQVVHMAVVNPALLHTLALVAECSDTRETSTRHRRFAIPPPTVLKSLTFIQRHQPLGCHHHCLDNEWSKF